jgi:anion-transporting  ArsA/GET3 family ATPase
MHNRTVLQTSTTQPQDRMAEARDLFRDATRTEFVIVTIPTIMAAAESCRLAAALRKESIPVKSIVINQVWTGVDRRGRAWTSSGRAQPP